MWTGAITRKKKKNAPKKQDVTVKPSLDKQPKSTVNTKTMMSSAMASARAARISSSSDSLNQLDDMDRPKRKYPLLLRYLGAQDNPDLLKIRTDRPDGPLVSTYGYEYQRVKARFSSRPSIAPAAAPITAPEVPKVSLKKND